MKYHSGDLYAGFVWQIQWSHGGPTERLSQSCREGGLLIKISALNGTLNFTCRRMEVSLSITK